MKKLIIRCAVVALGATLAGCGQIDSGEAGFYTEWGEVTSSQCLDEGFHFYPAIGKDLVVYDIRNKIVKVKTPVFTRDVQSMEIEMTVTYNLNRDKVISLHKSTGKDYCNILIVPSVLGATKDALGKMEAGDIVASREKATESIAGEIVRRLTPHGINVTLVNITNIDYSDAFEKAVEEKQVALQKSIKDEERDRPSARGRGAGGRQGGGRG